MEAEPRARSELLVDALDAQLARNELVTVRVLRLLAIAGAPLGLLVGATMSPRLGFACAGVSLGFLAWFYVYARLLQADRVDLRLRLLATAIESAIPWVFFAVIAATQGAEYALASWVPPMVFCGLVVAYAARLRPWTCVALGVVGAMLYPATYFAFVRPRLPADEAHLFALPAMQLTRGLSLFLAAGLGALVAGGLRRAIGRAESDTRGQELFGKYRLLRRIASGGMGLVFEALYCPEGGFERRVAVKRIHPHLAATRRFVDAFRAEAELSARLAHPSIVQVLDFGRVGDSFFLAMEFVDGLTLGALSGLATAQRITPSPAIVGHVLREILGALAYAHEGARGADGRALRVVHRDLCPHNVLVSRNGEVKLTDFGIARSLSDASASMTTSVSGHMGYMAPEQARATEFDTRADLFPVGVIAWELLARRPLFRRPTEAASLNALLFAEVPPITRERADLDEAWEAWLVRALAREPAERFSSAAEMLAALDRIPGARAAGTQDELAWLVATLEEARRSAAGVDDAPTLVDPRPD